MKLLMISQMMPYLPCMDGFRIIPANIIKSLSKHHDIHLITFSSCETGQTEWAEHYCKSVEIMDTKGWKNKFTNNKLPELSKIIRDKLKTIRPDLVHIEGPALAPLLADIDFNIPKVLSVHDSLWLRYSEFARFSGLIKRMFYSLKSFKAKRFEAQWYTRADRIVVTSKADAGALSLLIPSEKVVTIPNGVDLDYYTYKPSPEPGRIVFTGNMGWPPNIDGVKYFAEKVFPYIKKKISNAKFWIVGANPAPDVNNLERISGIHVTGTVPDIRPWVWKASVYVSPLRYGMGCKNKILEAMALGAPIVATPKSLTGIPLSHREHLLIAEGPYEMAEAVCMLLVNKTKGKSLSQKARQYVEENYSWDVIASRFARIYTELLNNSSTTPFDSKAKGFHKQFWSSGWQV